MKMTSQLEDSRERKKTERSEMNGKEEQNKEFFPFFFFASTKKALETEQERTIRAKKNGR